MARHIFVALWATARSAFGILGEIVLVVGIIGHVVAPKHVTAWVCVAGLALVVVAAVWELARSKGDVATERRGAQEWRERAWHYEKEWSRALTDRHTGVVGEIRGQREFKFPDPSQPPLLPPDEGRDAR